jgi:hypothetical protein
MCAEARQPFVGEALDQGAVASSSGAPEEPQEEPEDAPSAEHEDLWECSITPKQVEAERQALRRLVKQLREEASKSPLHSATCSHVLFRSGLESASYDLSPICSCTRMSQRR